MHSPSSIKEFDFKQKKIKIEPFKMSMNINFEEAQKDRKEWLVSNSGSGGLTRNQRLTNPKLSLFALNLKEERLQESEIE